MKILGLDTAMAACSVAVLDTARATPLGAAIVPMERGHAEALAPMVKAVMEQAGLGFAELDRIAVTRGPGTFTGVRIGLAMARGLGLALGIPVTGIDTLRAIGANEPAKVPLLVVADARNGEVYAALLDARRRILKAPFVATVGEAAAIAPADSMVIGTAADAVVAASRRSDLLRSRSGDLPVAAHFSALADTPDTGESPSPLYLRLPDAKPQLSGLRRAESLAFETATADSAPLLAAIHGEAFDTAWSATELSDLLAMPGASATLALELGEPVGFVLLRRAADEAEIITIATRPFAQRRGVAGALLGHKLRELPSSGIASVFLEVAQNNVAGRALYEALGFRQTGLRRGYYRRAGGEAEDAVVMRRDLVS